MKRNRSRIRRQRRGFTLMEVLLVLIILVVLAGFAIQNFSGLGESARRNAAKAQVVQLASSVSQYKMLMQQLPPNLEALKDQPSDLATPGDWTQLLKKIPLDPWGHPYEYKINGASFEIRCVGPDGQSGTSDDIVES